VHGDIWKGVAFESALTMAGFYVASVVLRAAVGHAGIRGVDDVAGLPLLVIAAGAVSLVMLPLAHAMSRQFERSADRFALDLTGNPAAFISAMRRLGAQNLAEEEPSRLVQFLFYSHPPMRDRIAAAQSFGR
jgi:STE24 endopeptidase